jgi:arginase
MDITIFNLPFDSGQKRVRMGRGPDHFLQNGAAERLSAQGHHVRVEQVNSTNDFPSEVSGSFRLYRKLSERVHAARVQGAYPLVLSGNCGSVLGALSGLQPDSAGLIWFDAHGDFNTPETTSSGFLDGMALAAATGRCWKKLAAGIPGFSPLPDDHIIHIGGRDFDPEERELLDKSGVALVSWGKIKAGDLGNALGPALHALKGKVNKVYVHIDLDVLDPRITPVNQFLPSGGLTVTQVEEAIDLVRHNFQISGAGLASYDPAYDAEGRGLEAGLRFLEAVTRRG